MRKNILRLFVLVIVAGSANAQDKTGEVKQLEEVIVVAYGKQKKSSFTGSVSTIPDSLLSKTPVTDFTKALEGLAPGVMVTNGTGQPGSSADIRIRGFGSINASNKPLIVLDGAPYDGDLSSISISDIESVTFLKDANAASLYGSRSANGVVVVTTKHGSNASPKLSFSFKTGLVNSSISDYNRIEDEKTYYELIWEGYRNLLKTVLGYSNASAGALASTNLVTLLGYNTYSAANASLVDPVTGKLNPSAQLKYHDNWQDETMQTGIRQDYNFNTSGTSEKSDYYLSMGYVDDKGILKSTGYKRYNARLNFNTQSTDWFKTGLNISGAYADQNRPFVENSTSIANPFYTTRMVAPIYPVYVRDVNNNRIEDPNTGGFLLDYGDATDGFSMGTRPYAAKSSSLGSLLLDKHNYKTITGNAVGYIEAKFLKNFTFRTNITGLYNNQYRTLYNNSLYGPFGPPTYGRGTKDSYNTFSYILNELLTWKRDFGKHSIDVLAGHENYNFNQKVLTATRQSFSVPNIDDLNGASIAGNSGSYTNSLKIESYLSRINYSYNEKYFAYGSFRTDGTSRFYKDVRWGKFWSGGLAWRITQEDFMKGMDWLNELKAKISYGQQGNESLLSSNGTPLYYGWQGLYNLSVSNGPNNAATVNALENKQLQWERSKNLNAGVDFQLFKNRISGSIEYFERKSDNLLFQTPYAFSTGVGFRFENVGAMKNYGAELDLNGQVIRTSNFDWNLRLNLTRLRNKVTALPPGRDKIITGNKQLMVGKSLYDFFISESAGVDPANGDELYFKDDANGNRVKTNNYSDALNNNGRIYAGSSIPDLFGGLSNSFKYKAFDFSFLVSFGIGGKYFDSIYGQLMGAGTLGQTWSSDILNRWTPENPNAALPRIEISNPNIGNPSTRFLFDASFLNVKNATFGYTLPASLTHSVGMSGLRIYAAADNLFLFSKRQGMDPQTSFNGNNSTYSYVPVRTVSLGLSVLFK